MRFLVDMNSSLEWMPFIGAVLVLVRPKMPSFSNAHETGASCS